MIVLVFDDENNFLFNFRPGGNGGGKILYDLAISGESLSEKLSSKGLPNYNNFRAIERDLDLKKGDNFGTSKALFKNRYFKCSY